MKTLRTCALMTSVILFLGLSAASQTTSFNFQGRMNDGASPANGTYDVQFKLYTAITGGSQVGTTVTRSTLVLNDGVFSTQLDFGADAFNGANRFLEIAVRPSGSQNAYVVLGSRQQIMAVPYAVRSLRSTSADGASFAVQAGDTANVGGFPAASYVRMGAANNGSVGLGTSMPTTRLTLNGGTTWTSNQWTASMNLQNTSAFGWEPNNSGRSFGVGQSNGGLYFFRTTAPFGTTAQPAQLDLTITDNGNIAQPFDRNGMVKAMLAVTANGTVARCYNGVTGETTGTCGFNVTVNGTPEFPGGYLASFPFDIGNRFWLVTAERSTTGNADQTAGVQLIPGSSTGLLVKIHSDGTEVMKPFHLFIF